MELNDPLIDIPLLLRTRTIALALALMNQMSISTGDVSKLCLLTSFLQSEASHPPEALIVLGPQVDLNIALHKIYPQGHDPWFGRRCLILHSRLVVWAGDDMLPHPFTGGNLTSPPVKDEVVVNMLHLLTFLLTFLCFALLSIWVALKQLSQLPLGAQVVIRMLCQCPDNSMSYLVGQLLPLSISILQGNRLTVYINIITFPCKLTWNPKTTGL